MPAGLPLTPGQWFYLLTLAIAVVGLLGAMALVASRFGRALQAVRDNPIAAQAVGISLPRYRLAAFAVSAFYAGIAGALSAGAVRYVAPDSFTIALSIGLFVGMVVGGIGALPAALFGGLFTVFVPNIAENASQGLAGAAYCAILLLTVWLMPGGLAGLLRRLAGPFGIEGPAIPAGGAGEINLASADAGPRNRAE